MFDFPNVPSQNICIPEFVPKATEVTKAPKTKIDSQVKERNTPYVIT
jgi:hypothetical protein